jgi:hypothetical protein
VLQQVLVYYTQKKLSLRPTVTAKAGKHADKHRCALQRGRADGRESALLEPPLQSRTFTHKHVNSMHQPRKQNSEQTIKEREKRPLATAFGARSPLAFLQESVVASTSLLLFTKQSKKIVANAQFSCTFKMRAQ